MSNAESNAVCSVNKHSMREVLLKFKTSFDMEREIHRRTDALLSSSFNVFNYLVDSRSEKGELMLSNVLAMILNADGEHGQGKVFQEMFLIMVKANCAAETTGGDVGFLMTCPKSGYHVMVEENITCSKTEDGGSQKGRIDISLHHSDGWIIGIENKPFAGDQPNQVQRYLDDMELRSDAGYGLIYLSGTGQPPSNHSLLEDKKNRAIAESKLSVLGYQENLMPFLQSCSQACRSPRFSVFLDDFAKYVSSRFPKPKQY